MSAAKPPTVVELNWDRDLVFAASSGSNRIVLDSASKAGASPMQALAFALAGCMAMDVVHVIRKGRFPLRALRANLTGERAADEPRRFTSIALHYTITGEVPAERVERAIQLSREKYCSVWHSMRHDIDLKVTYQVISG
jgi:putative redox protein